MGRRTFQHGVKQAGKTGIDPEQWLAAQANRPARTRDQLATLIDTSVYEEALALEAGE